jgi:hypothetical protein
MANPITYEWNETQGYQLDFENQHDAAFYSTGVVAIVGTLKCGVLSADIAVCGEMRAEVDLHGSEEVIQTCDQWELVGIYNDDELEAKDYYGNHVVSWDMNPWFETCGEVFHDINEAISHAEQTLTTIDAQVYKLEWRAIV